MSFNLSELCEFQKQDEAIGLVYPWWTHPFLEVLDKMDLSEKILLEFGCGLGTSWLRNKCKWVDSIDANDEWAAKAENVCNANVLNNGKIFSKNLMEGVQGTQYLFFDMIPYETNYDIISVDGIWRYECIEWAVAHFKNREGVLIVDNYMQDYVFICPAAEELLKNYEQKHFIQPDHTNHDGRPWQTSIFYIK